MKIILIGCGKTKAGSACPAKALYTGALTLTAIRHAEASGLPWALVSALHELVMPDQVLETYNVTLSDLDQRERSFWGSSVAHQIEMKFPGLEIAEIHAGGQYLELLEPALQDMGVKVVTPLRGLSIGRRLRWYKQQRSSLSTTTDNPGDKNG